MSAVDLTIRVRVNSWARSVDLINEVRFLLEREGWDPDATMHYEAVDAADNGGPQEVPDGS